MIGWGALHIECRLNMIFNINGKNVKMMTHVIQNYEREDFFSSNCARFFFIQCGRTLGAPGRTFFLGLMFC